MSGSAFEAEEGVAEAFSGCSFELLTKFGSGYGDHEFGSLGEVLAAQIHTAIFGDYEVGLEACGDNAGARSENGLDLVVAFICGGEHGEK